jgi:hypothetical protein
MIVDRLMRNNMALESSLPGGRTWDADSQPIGNNAGQSMCQDANSLCSGYGIGSQTEFTVFSGATMARSQQVANPTWIRDLKVLTDDPANPVISLVDSFTGTGSGNAKIGALNYHATGAVVIPDGGFYTPVQRVHTGGSDSDRPSNSNTAPTPNNISLVGDALNLFTFTGQNTIDWKSYVIPRGGGGALVNIGHFRHPRVGGSGPGTSDSQYIFRTRFTGDLQTIILPYTKGTEPIGRSVTYNPADCPGGTRIAYGTINHCLTDAYHTFTNGTVQTLRTWGAVSASYAGLTISGGPTECRSSAASIVCRINGMGATTRTVTLPPGSWSPDGPVRSLGGNTYAIFHPGGAQPKGITITWSTTAPALSTLDLSFNVPAGATQVRVLLNDNAVANQECTGSCTLQLSAPPGSYQVKHQWLNGSGTVLLESASRQVVI